MIHENSHYQNVFYFSRKTKIARKSSSKFSKWHLNTVHVLMKMSISERVTVLECQFENFEGDFLAILVFQLQLYTPPSIFELET